MTPFRFILLSLASYSLSRIVTDDKWPPSEAFRKYVRERTGPESGWSKYVTCSWCFGAHVTIAVFLVDHYLWAPPTWLLAMVAARTLVGILGEYAERE